jgi:hypothetical protein
MLIRVKYFSAEFARHCMDELYTEYRRGGMEEMERVYNELHGTEEE